MAKRTRSGTAQRAEVLQHAGEMVLLGRKIPKKSDFGAARRGSSTAQLQGAAVGTGSRGMGLGHSQNFLMTLFLGGKKKRKKWCV